MAAGSTPAARTNAARPSSTPRAGSAGTVGHLNPWSAPEDSSSRLKSVKVPPMSMPSRYRGTALTPRRASRHGPASTGGRPGADVSSAAGLSQVLRWLAPRSSSAHTVSRPRRGCQAGDGGRTMRLQDKRALITGGGSGIGRATAERFVQEGARVMVSGRRRAELEETVRLCEKAGGVAASVTGDVSRPEDAERMVKATVAAFGGIDVLVNNAGILVRNATVTSVAIDDWRRVIDVDL